VGQSRAGKAAHVFLAAELACDRAGEVKLQVNHDHFLQQFAESCDRQTYTLIDEIAKVALPSSTIVHYLQSGKRDVTYHKLYVGPSKITNPGVVVYADTAVPEAMRGEVQVSRRTAFVDLGAALPRGVCWKKTCETGDIVGWRRARPEFTAAADM